MSRLTSTGGVTVVLLQATDDFDVEWKRPEDAGYHWRWDEMHNPRPLVPMSQEFWPIAFSRGLGPMRFHIAYRTARSP
ncbi:MAG: hypothetical protein QGG58_12165, partial [Chloroflexota bacterium]|nr:hypothetical protein [Chloroflexota bacterium]